jgi:ferredoxin/flavodoxin
MTTTTAATATGKKVVIAYFSLTGNTKHVAERVRGVFAAHAGAVASVELFDVTGPVQAPHDVFVAADVIGIGSLAWGYREPTMLREWLAAVPAEHVRGKPAFVYGTFGGDPGRSISNVANALTAKGAIVVSSEGFRAPGNFACWTPKDAKQVWSEAHRAAIDVWAEKLLALVLASPPVAVAVSGTWMGVISGFVSDGMVKMPVGRIMCDETTCVGCGLCARICPKGAITMRDIENVVAAAAPTEIAAAAAPKKRVAVVHHAACVACCRCINNCPTNSLNSSATKGHTQYVFAI